MPDELSVYGNMCVSISVRVKKKSKRETGQIQIGEGRQRGARAGSALLICAVRNNELESDTAACVHVMLQRR